MWKLMIFGVVVQLVLLVSVLDVNVTDDGVSRVRIIRRPCHRNMMVISIEGLQYDDIMIAMNKSAAVKELIPQTATYFVTVSTPNATNYTDTHQSSGSIFDGKKLLYVGPHAVPYEIDTSLWDFIMLNKEMNVTQMKNHSGNSTDRQDDGLDQQMLNDGSYKQNLPVIVDHMRRIVRDERMAVYPIKYVNIGRSTATDEVLNENERVWYFTNVYEMIKNTPPSSNYIFIIISSMGLLVRDNYRQDQDQDDDILLIMGRPACGADESTPFFNKTLGYKEAFSELKAYADLTIFNKDRTSVPDVNFFVFKGNILEFIKGRALEMRRTYNNFGLYFAGWETLQGVLNALETMEIEINPVVLALTVFTFVAWVGFLCMKTVKLAVDSSEIVDEVNSALLKLLNVVCLVLIVAMCVTAKCSGCPCRYLIYISIAVLVFRLFCGEVLSSVGTQMEWSTMDKVKIGLQLFILVGVIECLFWSILYSAIILAVFVLAAFGRILHGSLSVMRFKTVIAFSLATLCIGLQYLWSFERFGKLVNLNVSASLWTIAGIGAIKFLMRKSNHDRFVLFVGVVEILLALSFANVFLIYDYSFYSKVPVVGFFVGVSLILPLFGGADPSNRLLELAAATSAVFVFFSENGESFFLLFSFISCFCSFMMDREASKKLEAYEDYFINILPAVFYVVLLILACHVVTPQGGENIMRAYAVLNTNSHYQAVANGIFYVLKLGFLVNLLEAAYLSSGKKLPNLFVVVIILNLISFRAFIQYSMFSYSGGRRVVFVNHILMHILAALSFYLYSFVQVLCQTNLIRICTNTRTTYVPNEAIH